MSGRPGISQDIRRVRRLTAYTGEVPLPPGMPRRVHRLPPTAARPGEHRVTSWQKVWGLAQYPLFATAALVAAANSTFGQLLVLGYALVVVIQRRPSQLSFGLALIILISVPLFQGIGQPGIAENAAIYVYELLVVGTISAILELKQKA